MENKNFMWAHLVHLGSNMWNEEGNTRGREHRSTPCASSVLRFDRELWDLHMQELKESGVNTLIVDVGEAMLYESHPEISAQGAFDKDRMLSELKKLRALGFEVIPKLNFSACHDAWLGDYSRMLSTPVYYRVCKELIDEVCKVFKPKHFHIGMDEEVPGYQANFNMCIVRQFDLWWHDLYYLVDCVEKNGARAWVWSDYMWNHTDEYLAKMPKSVMQNNWYYADPFNNLNESRENRLRCFDLLDEHGFDQVPAGSSYSLPDNFEQLTKFSKEHISTEHLHGMMQTVWERIDRDWMHKHAPAVQSIRNAKAWYEQN